MGVFVVVPLNIIGRPVVRSGDGALHGDIHDDSPLSADTILLVGFSQVGRAVEAPLVLSLSSVVQVDGQIFARSHDYLFLL
jgi:hypothetical protein